MKADGAGTGVGAGRSADEMHHLLTTSELKNGWGKTCDVQSSGATDVSPCPVLRRGDGDRGI